MQRLRIEDAAENNAAWCDAVCAARGRAGEISGAHWLCRTPAPPLYPNLVTFAADSAPALTAIGELSEALPSSGWAVKDSHRALELEPIGFRRLFDAEWIQRPARGLLDDSLASGAEWRRLRTESELAAWEAAWGESVGSPRIFLPSLLALREIAFLAAVDRGDRIVGGVIANRTQRTVGLTNFFARGAARAALRRESLRAALGALPGHELVGYASGQELAELRALGFERLGPLRVWVKQS